MWKFETKPSKHSHWKRIQIIRKSLKSWQSPRQWSFLTNLLIFILLLINLFINFFAISIIIFLLIKLILELILYLYGSKKLNLKTNLISFLLWFLIQMPYIIFSGISSFFLNFFSWQGRPIIQWYILYLLFILCLFFG